MCLLVFLMAKGAMPQLMAQSLGAIKFNSINSSDGLPNNHVNSIQMDDLGFIWIATNDGLCRYDSHNKVKVYKSPEIGLKSNNIKVLFAGSNHLLWIGTRFGGLTRLNYLTQTHQTYEAAGAAGHRLTNNEVLCVEEDQNGLIWVGTESGVNVLDVTTDSIHVFEDDKMEIHQRAVLSIMHDTNQMTWLGTWGGGLYLYLPHKGNRSGKGTFRRFDVSSEIGAKNIWGLYEDEAGRHWVATHGGGLYLMKLPVNSSNDPDQQDWAPSFIGFRSNINDDRCISSSVVKQLTDDRNGNIWIATHNGINILLKEDIDQLETNHSSCSFVKVKSNPRVNGSLNNFNINSIYKDKHGLIWIGTVSGVNTYDWYSNQFETHADLMASDRSQFEAEKLNDIYALNDSLTFLASDQNGLLLYDAINRQLLPIEVCSADPNVDRVYSIAKGIGEYLYLSTPEKILKYDLVQNDFEKYLLPKEIIRSDYSNHVTDILEDENLNLWIATKNGLYQLDLITSKYVAFEPDKKNPKSISDNSVTSLFKDSKGNVWIGTYNGLNLLVESDGQYEFKQYKRNYSDQIVSNQITSIDEFQGVVYFGTFNGLFSYDLNNQTFGLVQMDGIRHSILGVEINKKGELWASSTDGLLKYTIGTKETKLYSQNKDITEVTFRFNASHKDQHDNIYFGGNNGYIKIPDTKFEKNEVSPNLFITEITTINSENVSHLNGINLPSLTLEPGTYYLSIEFAALNYYQPEYNQYAYKLEGFEDEGWQYTDGGQQAVYTNLDPGEYVFRVKGANNEGVWNEEGASLKIKVKPFFTETIFFKIGCLVLLTLFAWLSINYYTQTIKKRNQVLREYNVNLNKEIEERRVVEEKLIKRERYLKLLLSKLDASNKELQRSNEDLEQFAYISSHDMKEPLRTIGSFTSLLKRRYTKKLDDDAEEYFDFVTEGVSRMSSLISSLLTYSTIGRKEASFNEVDLNKIIKLKIQDLSKIIEEKNAGVYVSKLPVIRCEENQIGIVFYNLILNGIKFNKQNEPKIWIDFEERDKYWVFSVRDNGIGIAPQFQSQIFEIFKRLHTREEYSGTGIGLSLCNKIIHQHYGKIWLQSKEGKGATFYFSISKNIDREKDFYSKESSEEIEEEIQQILKNG